MIVSFADSETESLWLARRSRRLPPEITKRALLKLEQLNQAGQLSDLAVPPSNHLEALKGDCEGQHSIRINKQWRICFTWTTPGPAKVEIVDYH